MSKLTIDNAHANWSKRIIIIKPRWIAPLLTKCDAVVYAVLQYVVAFIVLTLFCRHHNPIELFVGFK